MAFSDVQNKTEFVGFTGVQEIQILSRMESAYDNSNRARAMFDSWIATLGYKIIIDSTTGGSRAVTGYGKIYINIDQINDLKYINYNGTAIQVTLMHVLMHEFGHALAGFSDDGWETSEGYRGENVSYVNGILKELSLDKQISYPGLALQRNIL